MLSKISVILLELGFYVERNGHLIPVLGTSLPNICTVFQAEIYASSVDYKDYKDITAQIAMKRPISMQ